MRVDVPIGANTGRRTPDRDWRGAAILAALLAILPGASNELAALAVPDHAASFRQLVAVFVFLIVGHACVALMPEARRALPTSADLLGPVLIAVVVLSALPQSSVTSAAASIGLLAPVIAEEVMYRRTLPAALVSLFHPREGGMSATGWRTARWRASLISQCVFAAAHVPPSAGMSGGHTTLRFVSVLAIALVFAGIASLGTIALSIIAHAHLNAMVMIGTTPNWLTPTARSSSGILLAAVLLHLLATRWTWRTYSFSHWSAQ